MREKGVGALVLMTLPPATGATLDRFWSMILRFEQRQHVVEQSRVIRRLSLGCPWY